MEIRNFGIEPTILKYSYIIFNPKTKVFIPIFDNISFRQGSFDSYLPSLTESVTQGFAKPKTNNHQILMNAKTMVNVAEEVIDKESNDPELLEYEGGNTEDKESSLVQSASKSIDFELSKVGFKIGGVLSDVARSQEGSGIQDREAR